MYRKDFLTLHCSRSFKKFVASIKVSEALTGESWSLASLRCPSAFTVIRQAAELGWSCLAVKVLGVPSACRAYEWGMKGRLSLPGFSKSHWADN